MSSEQAGGILMVLIVVLKIKRTILLYILHIKMQKRMRNGQGNGYPRKQNGNLLHVPEHPIQ
ncbi:hypothetical protein D3C72_1696420 [compost metagenome]